MTRKLLTVEEAVAAGDRVVVGPRLDQREAAGPAFQVELRRPDGTCLVAEASATVPFVTPPPDQVGAVLVLRGVSPDDLPVGTEVWRK